MVENKATFEIQGKDNSDDALEAVADNLARVEDTANDLGAALKALTKTLGTGQRALVGVKGDAGDAGDAAEEAGKQAASSEGDWSDLNAQLKESQLRYKELAREAIIAGGKAQDALKNMPAGEKSGAVRIAGGVNPNLVSDAKAEARQQAQEEKQRHAQFVAQNKAQIALIRQKAKAGADASRAQAKRSKEAIKLVADEMKAISSAKAQEQEFLRATAASHARNSQQRRAQDANDLAAQRAAAKAAEQRFAAEVAGARKARAANEGFNHSLSNTRYALHDISMSAGVVGAALSAGLIVGTKAVGDYEAAVAAIQRTSEMSSDSAAQMRLDFVQLAQDLPIAFADLAKIGELGGQLNVPADRIADFTEKVGMFGATTDVTAEAAATAFGRLDALLPDVQGNYDGLGSSILKVGINSVATESEIISTTSQIAAAGAQAGLTADQVIGLSASFASLGVAPEAARGTVIRVLGLMGRAVAEGGEGLRAFAETAGVSAESFRDSWGSAEFSDTLTGFLKGLQREGKGAQLALADLGIWAARDQNNLLKLSQNTDLVTDAFADAATGMNNAGFMSDNFSIRADTLNSRLVKLKNSTEAFIAQAGETSGGALSSFVDVLNKLLAAATELVQNPFAQWLVVVAGGMTAVGAASLLMGSGMGRLLASTIAGKQAQDAYNAAKSRMIIVSRAAMVASLAEGNAVGSLAAKYRAATLAAGQMATAVRGIAFGLAGGVAIAAVSTAIDAIITSMESSLTKAERAIGDFSSLMEASAKDAEAAANKYGSVEAALADVNSGYEEVTVSIGNNNAAVNEAAKEAQLMNNSQSNLGSAFRATSEAVREQSVLIGDNLRAKMLETIITTEGMAEALTTLESFGMRLDPLFAAFEAGDMEEAQRVLREFNLEVSGTIYEQQGAAGASLDLVSAIAELNSATKAANEGLALSEGIFQKLGIEQQIAAYLTRDGAGAANEGAQAWDEYGNVVDEAGDVISTSADEVAAAFDGVRNAAQLGDAMAALIEGFGIAAQGADVMGGQVLLNVDNIQKAVQQAIIVGQAQGIGATEAVSAMFAELQRQGIDTANMLAALSGMGVKNIGGVFLKDIQKNVTNVQGPTSQLSDYFGQLAENAKKVDSSSRGAARGIDDAGNSAKNAAPAVRTLTDYASDLSSIWSRAFDIRFGASNVQDTITGIYHGIRNNSEAARKKVLDLRDSIVDIRNKIVDYKIQIGELRAEGRSLASERSVTKYFLDVAKAYNDVLRVGELTAKLGEIDSKIAKNSNDLAKANKNVSDSQKEITGKNQELKKAQEDTSMTLVGNSERAIENRKVIEGLVQEYQKKIEKLAAAGMSEAQLAIETEKLRNDFIKQATQLGFNQKELTKYSKSFDDVRTAIAKIPRNVTVTANVNPAIQAFNEMQAKANKSLQNVMNKAASMRSSVGKPVNIPINSTFNDTAGKKAASLATAIATQYRYLAYMASAAARFDKKSVDYYRGLINANANVIRNGGYKKGGFTGRGGKDEEAGIVHRGEFVIPQEGVNQSTGTPDMGWLMRNVMNTSPGAGSADRISNLTTINNASNSGVQKVLVINPVGLDVQSLHALNNMGGTDVVIGDDAIGRAASNSFSANNRIGAN